MARNILKVNRQSAPYLPPQCGAVCAKGHRRVLPFCALPVSGRPLHAPSILPTGGAVHGPPGAEAFGGQRLMADVAAAGVGDGVQAIAGVPAPREERARLC